MQELDDTNAYIDIPQEIRDFYRMYRPSPLVRAYCLEKKLGTPAHIYYKFEGNNTSGSHKLNSPDNLQFIFPAQADLAETQYVLANYFMKNPLGVWAICDKETNQMIGSIKFEKLDEIKGEAELGYFLRKDFWGKGLMTEAVKELVYLSFEKFQLKELKIVTHVENAGSQKVALKAGFRLFRQFKGSDRYTRKMRDYYDFRLGRGDFYE